MKPKLSDLWRWDGEIARTPFLIWAVVLFAVKYNLDRLVLKLAFNRDWSLLSYFGRPMPWPEGLTPARNPAEFALLLTIALPFLWMGVVLCLRRLRSAGLPLGWAVFFAVPILKWFLFLALALVPEQVRAAVAAAPNAGTIKGWKRWVPESTFGSAALAVD